MLVHPLSALCSSAHAWDLVGVVFKVELVDFILIITNFLQIKIDFDARVVVEK